jgi:hypothetical protein
MKKVTWKESTRFLGRNGLFKCNGVDFFENFSGGIAIMPITSKGVTGKCEIEIPVESIPQVIKSLKIAQNMAHVPEDVPLKLREKYVEVETDLNSMGWGMADIIEQAKEKLTYQQQINIASLIYRKHDANIGINWEVIDVWIDEVIN